MGKTDKYKVREVEDEAQTHILNLRVLLASLDNAGDPLTQEDVRRAEMRQNPPVAVPVALPAAADPAQAVPRIEYVQENPKRTGSKSHARFERYKSAKTLGQLYSLGGTKADFKYDLNKRFVKIVG